MLNGHGYFIEQDGTIRELLPGASHEVCARKWYRCKLVTVLKRGIVRIMVRDTLTQKVFAIDSGKALTAKQKKAIIGLIPSGTKHLMWSIADKSGDVSNDIVNTLFKVLGA